MTIFASRHPVVRTRYPRWGEEIPIDSPTHESPRILRLLTPPDADAAPARLLLVHGMNEYIGRYAVIARHFAQRFIVAGFDLTAHGLSNPILQQADAALAQGATEYAVSQAYQAQAVLTDLQPLRQDIQQALDQLQRVSEQRGWADKPLFIIAHSLGALAAASHLLQSPGDPPHGIILLGPAFAVPQLPDPQGRWINLLFTASFQAQQQGAQPRPTLAYLKARGLTALLDGVFAVLSWHLWRDVTTPRTPDWIVDYLSDCPQERADQRTDGWIIRRTLLAYVRGIEREIVRFRQQMPDFTVPYYLIYAAGDPITPAEGNRAFLAATHDHHPDNQAWELTSVSHHEHLFSAQPLRDELLAAIERWLAQRLAQRCQQRASKTPLLYSAYKTNESAG